MSKEREKMDLYTGSDVSEQIDMWLFDPDLRPQFDAIDSLETKRRMSACQLRSERQSSAQGFWQRLANHCPWQRHTRNAGAGS